MKVDNHLFLEIPTVQNVNKHIGHHLAHKIVGELPKTASKLDIF
jgi:hypothetical protein